MNKFALFGAAALVGITAVAGDWNVNFSIPETMLGYSGRIKNLESLQIDAASGTLFLERGKAPVIFSLATPIGKGDDLVCSFELTRLSADGATIFGIDADASTQAPAGLVFFAPTGKVMVFSSENKYVVVGAQLQPGRAYRIEIVYRRDGNVTELYCDGDKIASTPTVALPETIGGAFFIPQPPDKNRIAIRNFRMAWQQAAGK